MAYVAKFGRVAGAVALALGVTANSNAADPVLEWSAGILNNTNFLSAEFTVDSLTNPFKVTLIDNAFTAPFDVLNLAVMKKGGETMGTLAGAGAFEFSAPLTGKYVATVVGDPGTAANDITFSTFGVTVAAVPEPETWAMMLVGMGLVGWQLRRKVKASAAGRFV